MQLDKLKYLFGKYNNKVYSVDKTLAKYSTTDINNASLILLTDCSDIKQIDKYINNGQIVACIVSRDFDFNHLVKNTVANSVDAHIQRNTDKYIIIISKY